MSSAIQVVADTVYGAREAFASVLVDRSISFEREAEFAIQAISANDYTVKVARECPQSVVDATTNVAAIGISLNPAKKQAYLVPRKGRICLDISYMGLMDLAMDTGSIKWGQARIVYATDVFELNGLDREPTHRFQPFAKDRGETVGAYCVVKTADGDYLTEAMSADEINAIRDRSEAWKSFMDKKAKSCPWATDWGEMAKKTVVKRASKYWPKTERLDQAIHYLNTEGGEGLAKIEHVDNCPADLLAQAKAAAACGTGAYGEFFGAIGKDKRKQLAAHHESLKSQAAKVDANTIDMPEPEATE
ncbi:MAG: recombinase RecT [Sulfuricaulis sp.]|nr:recombinase RecT [Sulfuricaulis sp.]